MHLCKPKAILYYDGDCPFCLQFQLYVELRKKVDIELRNARDYRLEMQQFKNDGIDINKGLIVLIDGNIFHGAKALNQVQKYLEPKSYLETKFMQIMSAKRLMAVLYPLINVFRKVLLCLKNKSHRID